MSSIGGLTTPAKLGAGGDSAGGVIGGETIIYPQLYGVIKLFSPINLILECLQMKNIPVAGAWQTSVITTLLY
jgi:hypothetical protein